MYNYNYLVRGDFCNIRTIAVVGDMRHEW